MKKEIFKLGEGLGFRGRAKKFLRLSRERLEKALQYSYEDRREKDRNIDKRSLSIKRIKACTRKHGVSYDNFMFGLMNENIQLNKEILSEVAFHEPYSFKALVDASREGNSKVIPHKVGLAVLL